MNRIPKSFKPKTFKPSKIKFVKPNPVTENTSIKNRNLERMPQRDYLDFSTEELGYFTRREKKTGKILEVINIIFPR